MNEGPLTAEVAGTWSESELATLAAVAETFVRGGALRRAELAAEALTLAADPTQLRQLRLVLRLFESRAANLLLIGRPTPFRDLSPEAREQYLRAWGGSRLGLRRTAYQALARLLTFLAYAASEGEVNPRLVAIGYVTDDPPVPPTSSPVRPLTPPADGAPWQLDADVVVVGSGAGGAVVAHDLALAGRSVVVVEAGPFVDESTMPRTELDAFDRLYLDHGLASTWDGSVTLLAGSGVGGGTLINWMTCIDAPPDIRGRWVTEHGIDGWDAPAAEADVAAVESELGVVPSVGIPPKDAMIVRGATELGWEVQPTRRNAAECTDCGSCSFGCRRGSKQSALQAHLARGYAAGARVVAAAAVRRVIIENGSATGVVATLSGDGAGRTVTIRAPQVVVAAGGLRTPAVLERSGIGHPALGRNLRIHPVPVIAGLFDEPIDIWRGTLQAARSVQFLRPEAGHNPYIIESAPAHPGLLAFALPWEGTDRHAELLARARFIGPLIAVTEDGGEGRVSLTRSGRVRADYRLDAGGVATLRHALVSMARLARAAGARQILAAGTPPLWFGRSGGADRADRAFVVFEDALRSFDLRPNRGAVFSAHQMGTARMGAEAATHVCDPEGRVRSGGRGGAVIGGLYVADASLFPTGIGVNPMITVMALARRVGRTVLAEG